MDNQNQQNISQEIVYQSPNENDNNQPKKNNLGKVSKIIGIVSIALVFVFQIFVIPLAIIGLILGMKYKKQTGEKNIGILLNSISMIISIPILIIYSNFLFNSVNPVVGTWNCKGFGGSGESDSYIVTLKLNKNKTFVWNKYNDEENNYVKGNFTLKDLKKTNHTEEFAYYSIKLYGKEFVKEGKLQSEKYQSEYEMGVGKSLSKESTGKSILINVSTYNMYSCYLKK